MKGQHAKLISRTKLKMYTKLASRIVKLLFKHENKSSLRTQSGHPTADGLNLRQEELVLENKLQEQKGCLCQDECFVVDGDKSFPFPLNHRTFDI